MSRDRITIGRDPHSDVVIDERWDTVSNRHGEITYVSGSLSFIDHSSNGTVINGQKIHNTWVGVNPGDTIRLANAFELDWAVIERFFPGINRPTVTHNVRGESHDAGRRTVQMDAGAQGGRMTERFQGNTPERHSSAVLPPPPPAGNFGHANEYSQSEIDKALEKWNWGAFFCSWLWGIFNGVYWPLLVLLVAGIPYLGEVCSLCLSVYLGVNGSRLAWRTGKFKSFESFKSAQKGWAIGGIIFFALSILGFIAILNYTLTML